MVATAQNPNVRIFDRLMTQRHKSVWAENAVAQESVQLMQDGLDGLRAQFLSQWAVMRPDAKVPIDRGLRDTIVSLMLPWMQGRAKATTAALQYRMRERMQEEFDALVDILHPIIGTQIREQREEALYREAVKTGYQTSLPQTAVAETLGDPGLWIEAHADDAVVKIQRSMNRSMAAGEAAIVAWNRVKEAITGAVRGVETVARNEVETVVNRIARDTAESVKSVLPMEMWIATLDERCCLECASYDGETWPVGEGPQPQVHPRCHCYRTPYNPAWGDLADAEREAWFATEPGALAVGRRGQLVQLPGRTRRLRFKSDQPVRAPGRWETKKLSTNVLYDGWFKRQPADVQKIILGPSRYDLWKQGGEFSVKKFVDLGRVIPLSELSLN